MTLSLYSFWTPMTLSPLFWLVLTLLSFLFGKYLQKLSGNMPLVNPVLIAIILITLFLKFTSTSYSIFLSNTQFISFLLGPATVALAVPLARNFLLIKNCVKELILALVAGSLTSVLTGAFFVWLFDGTRSIALSMASKAVTTPIAISLAEQVGALPALTATLAIAGGIITASVGLTILRFLKISDWRAHGFAAGVAGSGIAAAQAAQINSTAAAFAAIGIGLNALITSLIVPVLAALWL